MVQVNDRVFYHRVRGGKLESLAALVVAVIDDTDEARDAGRVVLRVHAPDGEGTFARTCDAADPDREPPKRPDGKPDTCHYVHDRWSLDADPFEGVSADDGEPLTDEP